MAAVRPLLTTAVIVAAELNAVQLLTTTAAIELDYHSENNGPVVRRTSNNGATFIDYG